MSKSNIRPYLIATVVFLVILFVQPTISAGSDIIFDYLIRFIFCLLIGFGINWFFTRKKK
jgi:hypothetical protein